MEVGKKTEKQNGGGKNNGKMEVGKITEKWRWENNGKKRPRKLAY